MNELQTTYLDYFKHLATNHPLLLHSDEQGHQAFFSINIEETLGAFRSGIKNKGNALYLVEYSSEYVENIVEYSCGFVVMGFANDVSSHQNTKAECEQITKDILSRMRRDSENGHAFFKRSLNSLSGINTAPYNYVASPEYIGQITFFKIKHQVSCNYDSSSFNDTAE